MFLAAICVVVGLSIDAQSMKVNLLAGFACTGVGVPVAIWIVDRYLKNVDRARWLRVDVLTYRAIAAHLCDAMVQLIIDTPALRNTGPMSLIQEGRDRPDTARSKGCPNWQPRCVQCQIKGTTISPMPPLNTTTTTNGTSINCAIACCRVSFNTQMSQTESIHSSDLDGVRRTLHNAIIGHKLVVTGGTYRASARTGRCQR